MNLENKQKFISSFEMDKTILEIFELTKFDSDFRRLILNLDLNSLSENPLDLLSLNSQSEMSKINRNIITFLLRMFLCYNFSQTDFMILNIVNNLIKEINIKKQNFSSEVFNISLNYILNKKIKSFYQLEKSELSEENQVNNSIKINNSITNSMNLQNIMINNKNQKFSNIKLPYFFTLILKILSNFLINSNENRKISAKAEKSHSLKSSLIDFKSNKQFEINEFNPFDSENIQSFYNFIEKTFYFFQEILNDKEIISKLISKNDGEFSENDFNEKIYKFYLKSETVMINESIIFFHKLLFFKKSEKIIKNKMICFYFDNYEKILFNKMTDNVEKKFEDVMNKNLFLKDENIIISMLTFTVEALQEQFNLKTEELYENLNNILNLSKSFFSHLMKYKDINIRIKTMQNLSVLFEKGQEYIILLEEKIKQSKLVNEGINRIIKEEIEKNN